MIGAAVDSRGRGVQSHAVLHRPRRAARLRVRIDRLFEEQLNKRLKKGQLPVHVAFVPLSRDQLFPALVEGKVDLVAAALTITPERQKVVDFSNPTRTAVSEIVVTAKDVPPMGATAATCQAGKSSSGAAAATTRVSCD